MELLRFLDIEKGTHLIKWILARCECWTHHDPRGSWKACAHRVVDKPSALDDPTFVNLHSKAIGR